MDDGPDCGECAVVCCLACCEGACEACADSGGDLPCCAACVLAGLAALALAAVLVAAFAFVVPVRVSVDEASLGRLALLPAPSTNGTGIGAAEPSFSYDISLGVALRNPNWAMRAWRTGPLDAELRFRGSPFARARLASSEWDRIRPRRREVYRVAAAAQSAPVAIGSEGAAEFERERAEGVFEIELVVSGEAKYEGHLHRPGFKVSCPLKLSLSTATAPAAFSRVRCT